MDADREGQLGKSTTGDGTNPSLLQRILRHTEVYAAILLAIATVGTAWCAYQATRWNGVQSTAFAEASTDRSESNREFNLAIQLQTIDIELATLWLEAHRDDEAERKEFYENSLIRPELMQHLEEWIASEPGEPGSDTDAASHPLASDEYMQDLVADSERLRADAEEKFQQAKEANQTGDDYVLATVIFASVLFFAGIASKFSSVNVQGGLVALALLMLVLGGAHLGSLPIH